MPPPTGSKTPDRWLPTDNFRNAVASLVRGALASNAASPSPTRNASLDARAVQAMVKDAERHKAKVERFGSTAYVAPESPKPALNKRFLLNTLRDVDAHNVAVARTEQTPPKRSADDMDDDGFDDDHRHATPVKRGRGMSGAQMDLDGPSEAFTSKKKRHHKRHKTQK